MPRKLFFIALLALVHCAADGHGLFGLGDESKNKTALLWVPQESFGDWAAVLDFFKKDDSFKLTIGLTAEMITPEVKRRLDPWTSQGRLEIALRIPGDPVLPLIAQHRAEDPINRIAAAREEYRARTGTLPAGFVPGAGALAPELLDSFGAMGLRWIAAGDYNKGADAPWGLKNGATLVPMIAHESPDENQESPLSTFVLDEAGGLAAPGTLLKLISRLSETRSKRAWLTLSQALEAHPSVVGAETISPWPTWAGDHSHWTQSPAQQKAWKIYSDACRALERYQNSGMADIKVLENATHQLYQAQSSRYYLAPEGPSGAWQGHLAAIYRQINQTPPADLRASNTNANHGDSWLLFENKMASKTAPDENGVWKLLSLRVEWDKEDILFIYKMGRLEEDASAPHGFARLLLDTYIDLNGVVGAGETKLLEGRQAHLRSRDAWEYAIALSGREVLLYRFKAQIEPQLTAEINPAVDLKNGEIKVKISRSLLRGNPLRWGYFAAAMNPEVKEILSILGPAEIQKPLSEKSGGVKRFTAVRAGP